MSGPNHVDNSVNKMFTLLKREETGNRDDAIAVRRENCAEFLGELFNSQHLLGRIAPVLHLTVDTKQHPCYFNLRHVGYEAELFQWDDS